VLPFPGRFIVTDPLTVKALVPECVKELFPLSALKVKEEQVLLLSMVIVPVVIEMALKVVENEPLIV